MDFGFQQKYSFALNPYSKKQKEEPDFKNESKKLHKNRHTFFKSQSRIQIIQS